MNKETRSFIFGLILILICGVGFVIHLTEIENGVYRNTRDWILMFLDFFGVISGMIRVFKTID